ncbi:uncharacterized protein LOC132630668 [Lycium barbarum]|uniref:uncharacterized protein LOC132630668 n=1 Tax=Lycium barbarum TaxID=112863 RepID=UPI00293E6B99|nr:uncharacterized protein LOC132630668 [Lycium barbarum]
MKGVLTQWSRTTYGDIFKKLIIREEIVRIKEDLFEEFPSCGNRSVLQQSQAELKKYSHYEEEYWRQKSGIDWFVKGDRNTRFFHNLVKGRRKRLQIQRIRDLDGNWLDNEEEMEDEAVKFYHKQFTPEDMGHTNEDILYHIPCMLDQESNEMLCKVLSDEKVKADVFNLSGSSASRPHGFSGLFHQVCWCIVEVDVIRMVIAFFQGDTLPKVLHDRLEKVLPTLISPNQAGSVKGRSIIENVLLTQEIVTDTRKKGKRGVKQGDPLSPALFILTTEVLSRALNSMFGNSLYVGYALPKWSANINHLAYADDTIIFASAERNSLQMIMNILRDYEAIISGQLINTEKSAFYIKKKIYYQDLIKKVKDKLQSWKGRLLSYGDKVVLIGSVLQVVPVYVLSASNKEEDRSRHWVSWKKICMPKAEGGLGFRSLFDISKAFFAKLWWRFRTSNTLWSTFLWNKYCKKLKPTRVQWKVGSQVWKKMLEVRDQMDHLIWWEPRNGSCDVWEDNWTRLGPLRDASSTDHNIEEVAELMNSEGCDFQKMNAVLPEQVVNHVRTELSIMGEQCMELNEATGARVIELSKNMECCQNSQSEETLQHLFLTGKCAAEVWQYYTTIVLSILYYSYIKQW